MPLVSFSAGQVIKSADVNANFGLCVLTDTSRTVTVSHTWSATQTFNGGWTAGAACSISTGGLTVTAGGLTVSSGASAVQALSATAITATSNIFAGASSYIGWTSGSVMHSAVADGVITMFNNATTGFSRLLFGGTTASFPGLKRNSAGLEVVLADDSGFTTLKASQLTLSAAASKVIPGATSFSHRNNADNADNLLITDAGVVTLRAVAGALTITAGGTMLVGANQVVGARQTGYTNPWTGTPNRATAYDPSTVTLVQLAQRVKAIQDDLTVHGLIGV